MALTSFCAQSLDMSKAKAYWVQPRVHPRLCVCTSLNDKKKMQGNKFSSHLIASKFP